MDFFKLVLEGMAKVKEAQHGDLENVLIVPSIGNPKEPIKIGEIFGMDIIANPYCQDDHWFIQSKNDYERNLENAKAKPNA